jgi:hypothetical protein
MSAAELEMPRRRPGALRGPAATEAQLTAERARLDAALTALQALVAAIARGECPRGVRTASAGLTSLRRRYARLERETRYAAEQARRLGRGPTLTPHLSI